MQCSFDRQNARGINLFTDFWTIQSGGLGVGGDRRCGDCLRCGQYGQQSGALRVGRVCLTGVPSSETFAGLQRIGKAARPF